VVFVGPLACAGTFFGVVHSKVEPTRAYFLEADICVCNDGFQRTPFFYPRGPSHFLERDARWKRLRIPGFGLGFFARPEEPPDILGTLQVRPRRQPSTFFPEHNKDTPRIWDGLRKLLFFSLHVAARTHRGPLPFLIRGV